MNILTVLAATAEEPQGIAALGIDPLAILAQGATFFVLFIVIKKFALGPIVEKLEVRRKTIEKGLKLSESMESLKADMDQKLEAALSDARQESARIVADAHREAGALMKQAEESAVAKADALLADAAARIERDISAAQKQLRQEIVTLVVQAAETVLSEKIDAKKDAQLIEKALKEVRHG